MDTIDVGGVDASTRDGRPPSTLDDGTDHPNHREQASNIRRYLAWRKPPHNRPPAAESFKRAY